MKVHFFGASGEVTGSCYLLETAQARVLIDFGMHQGGAEEDRHNHVFPPVDPPKLNAVLLTHAHIDHVGRMPMITTHGYTGPIYTTSASADLSKITLEDSARIQESDSARQVARNDRRDRPTEPLYTVADVQKMEQQFKAVEYNTPVTVAPGVVVRWVDAGHILGSASLELTVTENGVTKIVVFSGDIGHAPTPMLRDPTYLAKADLVIMESTYGDRDHKPVDQTVLEFRTIIKEAMWNNERVIIPSFAIGRTQQLVYYIAELARTERVPKFPVYVDSPMAQEAFTVYRKHSREFDEEALKLMNEGNNPLEAPFLQFPKTKMESQKLNDQQGGCVIIAASGMCTGGRILHHLLHSVWRKGVHVIIAGYQAENTLGRQLVEKRPFVRIFGERITVRATIHTLNGLSAHAGQSELVKWASTFTTKPKFVLTHGEDKQRAILSELLRQKFGIECTLPEYGDVVEL